MLQTKNDFSHELRNSATIHEVLPSSNDFTTSNGVQREFRHPYVNIYPLQDKLAQHEFTRLSITQPYDPQVPAKKLG